MIQIQKGIESGRFQQLGIEIEIVKVCVRTPEKPRNFQLPSTAQYVTNIHDILEDTSINCIVEVMGGVTEAKFVILQAISLGKHVVTANKTLLASYMPEIQTALKNNPNVKSEYYY